MRLGATSYTTLCSILIAALLLCSPIPASAQSLFVAYNNGQIEQFSSSGVDQGPAVHTTSNFAGALAFDPSGNLFVSTVGAIQKFSPIA